MHTQAVAEKEDADSFVRRYYALATKIAGSISRKYTKGSNYDELLSGALEGVFEAWSSYRPGRGAKESTFVERIARCRALDCIRESSCYSRVYARFHRDLEKASSQLLTEGVPHPTDEQLAERVGIPVGLFKSRKKYHHSQYRESDFNDAELAEFLKSTLPAANDPDTLARHEAFEKLTRGLNRVDRAIIRLFFQVDMTLREIGNTLGYTESYVCRRLHDTLAVIRTFDPAVIRTELEPAA